MDHEALGVHGLGRHWLLCAEVKLGIDVVFDHGNLVLRAQCNQRILAVIGHRTAQGIPRAERYELAASH